MSEHRNPWRRLARTCRYEGPFVALYEDRVRNAAGHEKPYAVLHFQCRGVGVLAIDERERICLVGQHRYAADVFSWELPGGNAGWDDDPREAAARELKEETGLTAENLHELFRLRPSSSITDQETVMFVASGLQAGELDLDEQEVIEIRWIGLREAVRMVLEGQIRDASTAAAILAVHYRRDAGAAS